jgi:glycosyltransferase involved in cell wall biosynthesis
VAIFCRECAPDLPDNTVRDEVQAGLLVRRVVNNFRHVSGLESHYRNAQIEVLFRAYLLETHPDLIHFQHCVGLSAGLPAIATGLGIPFVLTLHDYWYICPTTRLLTRTMAMCSGPHREAECGQCLGPAVEVSGVLHRIPYYERIRDTLVPYALQRRVLTWLAGRGSTAPPRAGRVPQPFLDRMYFMQRMLASAPRLLSPSDFCSQVYRGYGVRTEAMTVLPWGFDLERWRHVPAWTPSSRMRVGYIGTLSAHKGVDVLVRAFRRADITGAELHVFGSGVRGDAYASELGKLAAGDSRIHFLGRYDNNRLPDLLAGVDVVVVPSRWHETFSIVAREALLAGRVVVASQVGAIPEVITNSVNGLLVPPADEAALAQALGRLAADQSLAARLAQAARATPHTRVQDHAQRVEAVYQEVMDRSPAGAA